MRCFLGLLLGLPSVSSATFEKGGSPALETVQTSASGVNDLIRSDLGARRVFPGTFTEDGFGGSPSVHAPAISLHGTLVSGDNMVREQKSWSQLCTEDQANCSKLKSQPVVLASVQLFYEAVSEFRQVLDGPSAVPNIYYAFDENSYQIILDETQAFVKWAKSLGSKMAHVSKLAKNLAEHKSALPDFGKQAETITIHDFDKNLANTIKYGLQLSESMYISDLYTVTVSILQSAVYNLYNTLNSFRFEVIRLFDLAKELPVSQPTEPTGTGSVLSEEEKSETSQDVQHDPSSVRETLTSSRKGFSGNGDWPAKVEKTVAGFEKYLLERLKRYKQLSLAVEEAEKVYRETILQPVEETPLDPVDPKSKTPRIIAGVIACVLILGAAVYFFVLNKH